MRTRKGTASRVTRWLAKRPYGWRTSVEPRREVRRTTIATKERPKTARVEHEKATNRTEEPRPESVRPRTFFGWFFERSWRVVATRAAMTGFTLFQGTPTLGSPLDVPAHVEARLDGPASNSTMSANVARARLPRGDEHTFRVDAGGSLVVDGAPVVMRLSGKASDALYEALLALAKERSSPIDATQQMALSKRLLREVEAVLSRRVDSPGRARCVSTSAMALAVVAKGAAHLDAVSIDALIRIAKIAPTPLLASMALHTLYRAPVAEAAREAIAEIPVPTAMFSLLRAWERILDGKEHLAGHPATGAIASILLRGAAFAKDEKAIERLFLALAKYDEIDEGRNWSATLEDQVARFLSAYIGSAEKPVLTFERLIDDVGEDVGKIMHVRTTAELERRLDERTPTFVGFVIGSEQAERLRSLLPAIRDGLAVTHMRRAMVEAAALFAGPFDRFASVEARARVFEANGPLSPSAFAMFERHARRHFDNRADAMDKFIDGQALCLDVRDDLARLSRGFVDCRVFLDEACPSFAGVSLSRDAASTLRELLVTRVTETASLRAIGDALRLIGTRHHGRVDAQGARLLRAAVDRAFGQFQSEEELAFGMLRRIVDHTLSGKAMPHPTVDGREIGHGEFHVEIAKSVAASIDPRGGRYDWIPWRWGVRAKESAKRLDAIADLAARGEGPLARLRSMLPGRSIAVLVNGRPGAHEEFLYSVEGIGIFNVSSDGTLHRFDGPTDRVLFEATVRDDGTVDVRVPPPRSRCWSSWPLSTTYAIGDVVDVQWDAANVKTTETEGEPTRVRDGFVPGTIVGYDARGNYRVRCTLPDGSEKTETLPIATIASHNNPHFLDAENATFYETIFVAKSQPGLRAFLEGARPIIDEHLPRHGCFLAMSSAERTRAELACVRALVAYVRDHLIYPLEMSENPTPADVIYSTIDEGADASEVPAPFERLLEIRRGQCRHQLAALQLLLQMAGIDSRYACGAESSDEGKYRGLHIWAELALADGSRMLCDPTHDDAALSLWTAADPGASHTPLWHIARGRQYDAYGRRLEIASRTRLHNHFVIE